VFPDQHIICQIAQPIVWYGKTLVPFR